MNDQVKAIISNSSTTSANMRRGGASVGRRMPPVNPARMSPAMSNINESVRAEMTYSGTHLLSYMQTRGAASNPPIHAPQSIFTHDVTPDVKYAVPSAAMNALTTHSEADMTRGMTAPMRRPNYPRSSVPMSNAQSRISSGLVADHTRSGSIHDSVEITDLTTSSALNRNKDDKLFMFQRGRQNVVRGN
jgi:hypothetical protein